MPVNNIAFKRDDKVASEIIVEVFKSCLTKDIVPVSIKEEEFICILSVYDSDMLEIEHLARKAKCNWIVHTGHISGTTIPITVGAISST